MRALLWRSGSQSISGSRTRARRSLSLQATAAAKEDPSPEILQLRESIESDPHNCSTILQSWIDQGNTLTQPKVVNLFQDLALKQRRAALHLTEFVRVHQQQLRIDLPIQVFVVELRLAAREYDPARAEAIYGKIPAELITEDVNAALLDTLVKNKAAFKAEKWVKKLCVSSAKPKTPQLWSAVISVYSSLDMHDQVVAAFKELKKTGTDPTPRTYLLVLKCKKRLEDEVELAGIEEESRAAMEKLGVEKTGADQEQLIWMMKVYASLGDAEMVDRIWEVLKSCREVPLYDSFMAVIECYGLLRAAGKAEAIFEEFQMSKKPRGNPCFKMVDVYARCGMADKAEELLEKSRRAEEKYFCNSLILQYLGNTESVDKALEMVKADNGIVKFISYECLMKLLPVYEAKKDVRSAKELAQRYLWSHAGDVKLFNSLLKVYVASGTKLDKLLKEGFHRLDPNEETLLLLTSLSILE